MLTRVPRDVVIGACLGIVTSWCVWQGQFGQAASGGPGLVYREWDVLAATFCWLIYRGARGDILERRWWNTCLVEAAAFGALLASLSWVMPQPLMVAQHWVDTYGRIVDDALLEFLGLMAIALIAAFATKARIGQHSLVATILRWCCRLGTVGITFMVLMHDVSQFTPDPLEPLYHIKNLFAGWSFWLWLSLIIGAVGAAFGAVLSMLEGVRVPVWLPLALLSIPVVTIPATNAALHIGEYPGSWPDGPEVAFVGFNIANVDGPVLAGNVYEWPPSVPEPPRSWCLTEPRCLWLSYQCNVECYSWSPHALATLVAQFFQEMSIFQWDAEAMQPYRQYAPAVGQSLFLAGFNRNDSVVDCLSKVMGPGVPAGFNAAEASHRRVRGRLFVDGLPARGVRVAVEADVSRPQSIMPAIEGALVDLARIRNVGVTGPDGRFDLPSGTDAQAIFFRTGPSFTADDRIDGKDLLFVEEVKRTQPSTNGDIINLGDIRLKRTKTTVPARADLD